MPQLKFRGIDVESIKKISTPMIDDLEKIINCPRNYFTLEIVNTTFISEGETSKGYPFVDILWFDRGQETKDRTAMAVTKHIQEAGYPNVDIMFYAIDEKDYYENGEHF